MFVNMACLTFTNVMLPPVIRELIASFLPHHTVAESTFYYVRASANIHGLYQQPELDPTSLASAHAQPSQAIAPKSHF
jgi:hypothetical protein